MKKGLTRVLLLVFSIVFIVGLLSCRKNEEPNNNDSVDENIALSQLLDNANQMFDYARPLLKNDTSSEFAGYYDEISDLDFSVNDFDDSSIDGSEYLVFKL